MVARCLETLEAASCEYYVVDWRRVVCMCETRTETVEEALKNVDLILADERATDPECTTAGRHLTLLS